MAKFYKANKDLNLTNLDRSEKVLYEDDYFIYKKVTLSKSQSYLEKVPKREFLKKETKV